MSSTLYDLPDDVLIYNITFLSVPDILLLRQTCKRFNALTRLPIVWTNAFKFNILANNYPFSPGYIDLEHRTRSAYRLASRWLADTPLIPKSEVTFTGSTVYEIKFIPGRQHRWLLTLSLDILSVLTIWNIERMVKCSEWSYKGAIFNTVKLNTDPDSEACITVSFLSETVSTMVIYNWKTGTRAYLDEGGDTQYGHRICLQVVFTPSTILVVRACSISAYVSPLLLCGQTQTPIATHPFGWVEDFSISSPAPNNPLSILIRYEDLDFGPSVPSSLELYSLSSFPPILTRKLYSYCTQFVLGKRATAICVRYKEHDIDRKTLIAVVFPGPLNPTDQVRIREVYPLDHNWSALDYDEDTGRIAIYSGYGKITILQL
ncbi:hypothetical protein EDD85DRAFT_1024000 [Armillaria nabsnona]|nr:hypothetical protein EDD85DRAFT_1024000 [Armillaria nabsnona]